MLLDVIDVKATPDFGLIIEFENGEKKFFNMEPFICQKPWVCLKEKNAFLKAYVKNGTVVWPGNVDIDPESLYEYSLTLDKNFDLTSLKM